MKQKIFASFRHFGVAHFGRLTSAGSVHRSASLCWQAYFGRPLASQHIAAHRNALLCEKPAIEQTNRKPFY
ncbi:MAG: hypothetical protein RBR97_18890 [Bacteroidales bacterium]|nr:hypothetical protein [Bacteroidales bacterium]